MYLSPLSRNSLVTEKFRANMVVPWGWNLARFSIFVQLVLSTALIHMVHDG